MKLIPKIFSSSEGESPEMLCNLCEKRTSHTESFGIPPRIGRCPHCGSKPRHRELAWFFEKFITPGLGADSKVLEVGPSLSQTGYFTRQKFLGQAKYTAIDVRRLKHHSELKAPHRFLEMDVTHMTFSDQSLDFVICNHVLPYIRSDFQAMAEIHRCLKSNGMAILNVVRPLAKTRPAAEMAAENPGLYTKEYLAENGNEWIYGEDYFERLEAAGFFSNALLVAPLAGEAIANEHMFRPGSRLTLCFKFKDSMNRFLESLS